MAITIHFKLRGQANSKVFNLDVDVTANSFLDALKELDKLEKELVSRYPNIIWDIDFQVSLYKKDEFP